MVKINDKIGCLDQKSVHAGFLCPQPWPDLGSMRLRV
jgi:hypothetical protein